MIKSASQSSLTNDVKYRNLDTFNVPSSEYLIETVLIGSTTASVTFSNLAQYAGVYKHLQIAAVGKTDRAAANDNVIIRFNGDSGTNYSIHNLQGTGSSVVSGAGANETKVIARAIGGNTGNFGAVIIDILDAFQTTKYPTVRSLGGYANVQVELGSGSWRSTAGISSITLDQDVGSNFLTGSRFSLYGVTA